MEDANLTSRKLEENGACTFDELTAVYITALNRKVAMITHQSLHVEFLGWRV